MPRVTFDKVAFWTIRVMFWFFVALYIALFALFVIWRIFGDHHAHNGAMQFLRLQTG